MFATTIFLSAKHPESDYVTICYSSATYKKRGHLYLHPSPLCGCRNNQNGLTSKEIPTLRVYNPKSVQGQNCPNAHPRNVYHTRSIIFCIVFNPFIRNFLHFREAKNKHRSDALCICLPQVLKCALATKDKCREFWKFCGRKFRGKKN